MTLWLCVCVRACTNRQPGVKLPLRKWKILTQDLHQLTSSITCLNTSNTLGIPLCWSQGVGQTSREPHSKSDTLLLVSISKPNTMGSKRKCVFDSVALRFCLTKQKYHSGKLYHSLFGLVLSNWMFFLVWPHRLVFCGYWHPINSTVHKLLLYNQCLTE